MKMVLASMLTSAMAALSGIVVQKILWTAVPHTNWGLHCIRRTDSRRRKLTKSGETVPLLPWWNMKNHAELSNISVFSYKRFFCLRSLSQKYFKTYDGWSRRSTCSSTWCSGSTWSWLWLHLYSICEVVLYTILTYPRTWMDAPTLCD